MHEGEEGRIVSILSYKVNTYSLAVIEGKRERGRQIKERERKAE